MLHAMHYLIHMDLIHFVMHGLYQLYLYHLAMLLEFFQYAKMDVVHHLVHQHMAATRARRGTPGGNHGRQCHRRAAPFDRLANHRAIVVQNILLPVRAQHRAAAKQWG